MNNITSSIQLSFWNACAVYTHSRAHEPVSPDSPYGLTDDGICYAASSSSSCLPKTLLTWNAIYGSLSDCGTLFHSALGGIPYPTHLVFATRVFSHTQCHSRQGSACTGCGTCPLRVQRQGTETDTQRQLTQLNTRRCTLTTHCNFTNRWKGKVERDSSAKASRRECHSAKHPTSQESVRCP